MFNVVLMSDNGKYLVRKPTVVAPLRGIVALYARRMQRCALAPTRQERQHHRAPTHARRTQHADGAVRRIGPQLARHMHGHQLGPTSGAGERGQALGTHAVITRELPGATRKKRGIKNGQASGVFFHAWRKECQDRA